MKFATVDRLSPVCLPISSCVRPKTEASLLNSMGNASAHLGMPKDAVDFYTKALAARPPRWRNASAARS